MSLNKIDAAENISHTVYFVCSSDYFPFLIVSIGSSLKYSCCFFVPKIRFFLSFFLCKILFSCNYCILLLCIPSRLRTRGKKSIYLICNYQQRMTSRNYSTLFMEKLLPFFSWSAYLLFLFRFSFNASCTVCISFFVSPFCLCTCLYICPCLYICLCLSICACISISVCVYIFACVSVIVSPF